MSYLSKRLKSRGSSGLTGMILVSPMFFHTRSRNNSVKIDREETLHTSFVCRILFQVEYKCVPIHDLDIASDMDSREWIVAGNHNAMQILINNHSALDEEDTLTRCEESANIFSASTASALSGQWNTKNPANTKLFSTESLDNLLIYHQTSSTA